MARTSRTTADTIPTPTTEETTPMTSTSPAALSYGNFSVPVDSLPQSAVTYLLQYGFGKSLQDAASGIVKHVTGLVSAGESEELTKLREEFPGVGDSDLPRAVADGKMKARFDAILEGTVGVRTGGGKPKATSLESEMLKVAKEFLAKFAKSLGKPLPKTDTDDYKAILARYSAKNEPAIREEAERRLGAAPVVDADDIFG